MTRKVHILGYFKTNKRKTHREATPPFPHLLFQTQGSSSYQGLGVLPGRNPQHSWLAPAFQQTQFSPMIMLATVMCGSDPRKDSPGAIQRGRGPHSLILREPQRQTLSGLPRQFFHFWMQPTWFLWFFVCLFFLLFSSCWRQTTGSNTLRSILKYPKAITKVTLRISTLQLSSVYVNVPPYVEEL